MKMMIRAASVAAMVLMSSAAFAADTATAKTSVKAKTAALVCPVTGDKIASVKDAVGHSTYRGKTYYFCCPSCKPEFDKNPGKYTKSTSIKTPMMKKAG